MRKVTVSFPSGKEVLGSYWGFLSRGGLVLRSDELGQIAVGEHVDLDIKVRSLKRGYATQPQVVQQSDKGTYVLFDRGDHQEMLNAAWADSNDVPQRKHIRFSFETPVTLSSGGKMVEGRVLDVSSGGCRLRSGAELRVGQEVNLRVHDLELAGRVRWVTPAHEVGIEFFRPSTELTNTIRA